VVVPIQRVEAPGGAWAPGTALRLHTPRGVLALEAPDADAHSAWALGLNAGLAAAGARRAGGVLDAAAGSIPRSPLFIVLP